MYEGRVCQGPLSSSNFNKLQGCCLTGARLPETPRFRVQVTKVLFKEPNWAPKHGV